MFKLDENAVNTRFGHRLDMLSSSVASRSVGFPVVGHLTLLRLPKLKLLKLLGCEEAEIGLQLVLTNKLIRQKSEVSMAFVAQQAIDAIVEWILKQHALTGCSLTVGPLAFEYEEGLVTDGDQLVNGVEVVIVTFIEWNKLR